MLTDKIMLNYNYITFQLIGGFDPLKKTKFVFQGFILYTQKAA